MNNFLTKFVVGAFALAFSVPNATAQTQLFTSDSNNKPGYRIPAQFNSSVFGAWLRQPEYGA